MMKNMTKLLNHEKVKPLLSDEHFSVDGTLIEAWASAVPSAGVTMPPTARPFLFSMSVSYLGHAHQSTTDPEAKLYRKADGREAKLASQALLKKQARVPADYVLALARIRSCEVVDVRIKPKRKKFRMASDPFAIIRETSSAG
jgi:hypothetical protein